MKIQSKSLIYAAATTFALATLQSLSAAVFDFSGGTPVYDANRSTETTGNGLHYYGYSSQMVGFNWANSYWAPSWYYSWDGINVSSCNDLSADVSKYYMVGEKAGYTSVTGTDGSGVSGGSYGVFYGNTTYTELGKSSSDMGMIVVDSQSSFSSMQIANTLVTYDYLTKTLTDDGDFYTQQVLVYGITDLGDGSSVNLTDNCVTVALSGLDGVESVWLTADLSALNTPGGLWGLYFEIYTNNYNSYGALAPAFFALDNIAYQAIPEPAQWAVVIGISAALIVYRRKRK